MKKGRIIYFTATGLLTAFLVMSVGMYIFNYDVVSQSFIKLGYPIYIIYPLVVAKLLGLTAIWTEKSKTLKEWAYAGFFFNFLLAFFAHVMINDGEFAPALIALLLLASSYFTWNRFISSLS